MGRQGEAMATTEFFFDLVHDSVIMRTMGGTIKFWNRSAEILYGWRKEEAIGRVSHKLLQTTFPKSLKEIESELVRNGVWKGRLVHKTRDGRQVVVESRWALPMDGQSEALVEINTRSSGEDQSTNQSTDRIKAAVSRTEQTPPPLQQQEYLIDLIKDSVITRATDGTIKFWNQGAENLYGWRKEEAIGRVSHDLLRTQFPQPLEAINSDVARNGRWEGKLVHTTRDGRQVVVKSRWSFEQHTVPNEDARRDPLSQLRAMLLFLIASVQPPAAAIGGAPYRRADRFVMDCVCNRRAGLPRRLCRIGAGRWLLGRIGNVGDCDCTG